MRIKDGFMLREVAEQWVVIPLGERVVEFNGIMTLSESGAMLWKEMEKEVLEEDLLRALRREYDVDEEMAKSDIAEYITYLREKSLLED